MFFKQKRIGNRCKRRKNFFQVLKYRSMKMSTPKDIPTHLLKNSEQYITKISGFLRKTSLDEFPEIFNILVGQMSIIGPCPALWNQDDLYKERAKYGTNTVTSKLINGAQIKDRGEFEIAVKARLDSEYVEKIDFLMLQVRTVGCEI